MVEVVEEFKCPGTDANRCNASIFIRWGKVETSRSVHCTTCFGQDWLLPEYEDPKDKNSKVIKPQTVTEHGWKGTLIKSTGLRTFKRDTVTKIAI